MPYIGFDYFGQLFDPVYSDKADFNTNAKSYYDALARNKEFLKLFTEKLIQLHNELEKDFEEHKEFTQEKIDEFQTRLNGIKQEMIDFFNQWLADGVLHEVINQDILNQKATYINARSFSGNTGGERIQKALDVETPYTKIVLVESDSLDDSGIWLCEKGLRIPSNTYLVLNGAYLKLADNATEPIFRNQSFDSGNHHLGIIGLGDAVIDCNKYGQNSSKLIGINQLGLHFYNIDNFTLKGFTIKDPFRQCLVPEKATNGLIDVKFDTQGDVNQDGLHILGPSSNIQIPKLSGYLGDDALVFNAQENPPQGYGSGGSIHDITVGDLLVEGVNANSHMGVVRLAPGMFGSIKSVLIHNIIGKNVKQAVLRIGGNTDAPIENVEDISINNIKGIAGSAGKIALIYMMTGFKNLQIGNAIIESPNEPIVMNRGKSLDGLQIQNLIRKVIGGINDVKLTQVFEFINGSIKNVQIDRFIDKSTTLNLATYLVSFSNTTTVENIKFSSIIAPTVDRLMNKGTASNFKDIVFNDVMLKTKGAESYTGINSNDDITVNGLRVETGDGISEIPLLSYHIGTLVKYRISEGENWRLFLATDTGTFIRLDRGGLVNETN